MYWVLVHEIGHLLGLNHQQKEGCIMSEGICVSDFSTPSLCEATKEAINQLYEKEE